MIEYRSGSIFSAAESGLKILPHIVNTKGGWGKGFVNHLSKKWKEPEIFYRSWVNNESFLLGNIQVVTPEPEWIVVNMLAQEGYSTPEEPAIRYLALQQCLIKVASLAEAVDGKIVTIKFGTGLAGGTWDKIEPMLSDLELETYIYVL